MTYVASIIGQPSISVIGSYDDALTLFKRVAEYDGLGYITIGGTYVLAENTVIGYLHHTTDYRMVQSLKAAAELDANGYRPHADAIRHRVGQYEAMKRNETPEWDECMTELVDESTSSAIESHRGPNN